MIVDNFHFMRNKNSFNNGWIEHPVKGSKIGGKIVRAKIIRGQQLVEQMNVKSKTVAGSILSKHGSVWCIFQWNRLSFISNFII